MNSFLLQLVVAHLLVGSALTGLVAVALRFLPGLNAASRHAVWAVVLLLLVAMPLLALLPDLPTAASPVTASAAPIEAAATTPDESTATPTVASPPAPAEPDAGAMTGAAVALAWLIGVVVSMLRLLGGLRRTRWHYDRSEPASSFETLSAQKLAREAGISRVVEVRRSAEIEAPMTVGVRRPWVALPVNWPGREDQALLRHTLAHEIAHIARRDPLTALVERIGRVLFFYHPGVLYACHRMAEDRESACDDWAIARSGRTASRPYAESLLAVAEAMVTRVDPVLAVGCLRSKRELTRRITHMLDRKKDHTPRTRWLRVAPLGAAAVVGLFLTQTVWPDPGLLNTNVRSLIAAATPTGSYAGSREIQPDEKLLYAAWQGDLASARAYLADGADVDEIHRRKGSPRTALTAAAGRGHGDMVALLLEAGADPNVVARGDASPLMAALDQGHEAIALTLLEAGARADIRIPGDGTPLISAARGGSPAMIAELLERGADPNVTVAGDGSALISAVRSGNLDSVVLLLDAGAEPDVWVDGDESPLYHAVVMGEQAIAATLIEAGADVNARWDGDGTPLMLALRRGDLAMTERLLAAGADMDTAMRGDGNALIEAVRSGKTQHVQVLLELGADVNGSVRGDGSPLINAARMGRLDLVEALVAAGADVNLAVPGDDTPLINAVWSENEQVVALLLKAGADVNQPGDVEGGMFGERRTPLNQASDPEIRRMLHAANAR